MNLSKGLLTILALLFLLPVSAGCAPTDHAQTISKTSPTTPMQKATATQTEIPAKTAAPAFHPTADQGQILFSTYPYGDIGLINADCSGRITLLDQPINQNIYNDRFAVWLPDGSGISYTIDNFTRAEIWVMDLDITNPRKLIQEAASFSSHTWSPDGNSLAYVSPSHNILIYSLEEKTALPLTDGSFLSEDEPDWSPNGTWIVFSGIKDGNRDIYIIHPDGSGLQRVTNHPDNDQHPDWAPDSAKIAFSSTRDGDYIKDIFSIDITHGTEDEGNLARQITMSDLSEIDPDWSPDGNLIVYSAHGIGATHATLFIMDDAGQHHFQLTERNIYNSPKWHP